MYDRTGRTAVVAALALICSVAALAGDDDATEAASNGRTVLERTKLEKFLTSIIRLDRKNMTVTLPLFAGRAPSGEISYYIVTESSDFADAKKRGVNYSPFLTRALGTRAVQQVTQIAPGVLRFSGTVDFRPARALVGNPSTGFPPLSFQPGSVADALYTPLITVGDGVVLNAPQIANSSGVHDKVVELDTRRMRATLRLTEGFYEDLPILYISTDASLDLAATLEASTYAPNLNAAPAPGVNDDDSPITSRQGIILVVNGARGAGNPERQGLESAVSDGLDPLNVLQEEPNNNRALGNHYSPLWDAHLAVWSSVAILNGQRERIINFDDVAALVQSGQVVSAPVSAGPANPLLGGLRASNFVVNCPVMAEPAIRGRAFSDPAP
jgi:hypothetical protein